MGLFLKEYDIYIPGFLEALNLRFAPKQSSTDGIGGVQEMAELQKTFHIFAKGRSFRDCAAVLGLGGALNWQAKNRWFDLLEWLKKVPSETSENGSDRIVSVLEENLAASRPHPVHFTSHDFADDKRVLVRKADQPHFFLIETFITISLPMSPRK
jgi:hypothetical protein